MLTLANILVHLLEGSAVTGAIYLITKKTLDLREIITIILTISVTFMILDLFAPQIGMGARHGTGFGLGYTQFAGDATPMNPHYFRDSSNQSAGDPTPYPRKYFESNENQMIRGMDESSLTDHYSPYESPPSPIQKESQCPSVILSEYQKNPFQTNERK
jgi:hypothetical protein